jgi:hypothetical protein
VTLQFQCSFQEVEDDAIVVNGQDFGHGDEPPMGRRKQCVASAIAASLN